MGRERHCPTIALGGVGLNGELALLSSGLDLLRDRSDGSNGRVVTPVGSRQGLLGPAGDREAASKS